MSKNKVFLTFFLTIIAIFVTNSNLWTLYNKAYTVRVGICSTQEQAEIIKDQIVKIVHEPVYIVKDSVYFKIQVGTFSTKKDAESTVSALKEKGWTSPLVVPLTQETIQQLEKKKTLPDSRRSYTHKPHSQTLKPRQKHQQMYALQVGVCSEFGQAKIVRDKIAELTDTQVYIARDSLEYKILIGSFVTKESAQTLALEMKKKNRIGFVVPALPPFVEKEITPQKEKPLITEIEKELTPHLIKEIDEKIRPESIEPMEDSLFVYAIQLTFCTNDREADSLLTHYRTIHHIPAYILVDSLYLRILTGKLKTQNEAEDLKNLLEKSGHLNTVIIKINDNKQLSFPYRISRLEKVDETETIHKATEEKTFLSLDDKMSHIKELGRTFYIEIDMFREKMKAEKLQKKLQKELVNRQPIVKYQAPYYKIILTDFKNLDEAIEIVSILQNTGHEKALVVFESPDR